MPPGWLRPLRSKIASIVVSWPTPVIIGRLGMPIFRENSTTGPQPGMEQLELSRNDPTTFIWPISISKRAIISIWRQHAVEGLGFFWWCGRPLVSVYVLLPLNTLNNFKMCLSTLWIHANRLLALDHHYTIQVNLSFYAIFMRRDWFRWSKIMFSFSKTELFNALALCPSYCESILVP